MLQSLQPLPQHVKQSLHQATTHTTSFSESFAKLFSRGDVGERRFHGMIGGVIRDLSSARGGAEGLASAMTTVFERMNVGGLAGGAVLVGVGIALERLVSKGEELRKTNSEIEKATQQMQHALKLSTAAEGYSALASKAQQFHKEERRAHDEAAKDEEHFIRLIARRAEYLFKHPLAGRAEVEKHVKE
jgi:prefoldin subunit 5